jgi:hypothetical protein
MVIALQPSRFPDERTKIIYFGSFLRDTAFLWFQPYITGSSQQEWMNNLDTFIGRFKEAFGDPDEEATAERNLFSLRQKGSAATYAADFQRYASLLSWDKQALKAQYYRGLKEQIKDEFARTGKPETFQEMVTQSIRIDNRLFERSLEKSGSTGVSTTTTTTVGSRNFTPRAPSTYNKTPFRQQYSSTTTARSEQDRPSNNFNRPGSTTSLPLTRSGKLDPSEYQKRKDANLCLYCGAADHAVAKCPLAKPRNNTNRLQGTTTSVNQQQGKGQAISNQ